MAELSSNRNVSLKIESFNIESEDSKSINGNDNVDKNNQNLQNKSDEEKPYNININIKNNSTINQQQNNIILPIDLAPPPRSPHHSLPHSSSSSDIKEKKSKSSSLRKIISRLPLFNDDEDIKSNKINIIDIKEMNKFCLVCDNKLTIEELNDNFIDCFHGFCNSCYYDYLKENINNNNIEKIKCLEHNCDNILFDDFIQDHLKNDIPLLEKYIKFKKRRQLMLDPNIQLCPHPNCESYASKMENNNYVTCLEGHKFCFNCLKDWHGKEKCNVEMDPKFENWKNSKNVKRCPNCKYFIEKNEGCNHMTCINCKYEWCWYCLKESLPGHYDEGGYCEGLQFTKSQCFSNRFCVFLYHFLLQILGILKFVFLSPITFFIFIFKIIEDINDDVIGFFKFFITFYYYLIVFVYVIYVLVICSIIMTLYWPLRRKISDLVDELW